jgi:hypothetical protein
MKGEYLGYSSDEELKGKIAKARENKKVIENEPVRNVSATSYWEFLVPPEDDSLSKVMNMIKGGRIPDAKKQD